MQQKEKVTITLPREVMNAVREAAEPRGYSSFIAEAVTYFVEERRRRALRERLIAGYQANAEADQAVAEEWRASESDGWPEVAEPAEDEA